MSETKNDGAKRPVNVADVPMIERSVYPRELAIAVKGRQKQGLGDLFGLSQFGVNRVTLQPGAKSSLRHWHSQEDEFILILSGDLTLIDDGGETPMRAPGKAAPCRSMPMMPPRPSPARARWGARSMRR